MSDSTTSPSNPLDSLAPGVVLMGRYSLKDRVPRWIAERRFKARDLESGDIVAVLIWPDSVPWMDEFMQKAETLSPLPFRAVQRSRGLYLIITEWVLGMRELTGEADTAEAVLEQLQKSPASASSALPSRRSEGRSAPTGLVPSAEIRMRTRPEPPPAAQSVIVPSSAPAAGTINWQDWVALGIGLAVALIVGCFAWQMTQTLRQPLVIEKKSSLAFLKTDQFPTKSVPQLVDAQNLRKNGNTTSALELLLELQGRSPGDPGIQTELDDLLRSFESDLSNLRAGFRPPLVRAINRAAEMGNAEAVRLREALTVTAEKPATSPEPLPIH